MTAKSALIANGYIADLSKIKPQIANYSRIVAVDGGLAYCKQLGIIPHLIVGDFDSTPPSLLAEYSFVPKIALERDKDQTDLEVALENERAQGSSEITLFGAWGGRIDHSVTNLLIASRYPGKVRLETENEIVFALQGETYIPAQIGQTLSLLPLNGPVTGITTNGLKWELYNGTLDAGFVGISNVCLKEQIKISIREGILICSIGMPL